MRGATMCLYHDPSSVWQEVTRTELEADLIERGEEESAEAERDEVEPPTPADD